jgi:chemotaxis protein MotB
MALHNFQKNLLLLSAAGALGLCGCVSRSAYDDLQAQNQQLQAQNQQLQQHVGRLQNAMKYTVNSDLLFAPGSWKMSSRGKQIIARMASKLAPTQQDKLYVNGYTDNTPIGGGLRQQGIESNQQLSEKRAEAVTNYLISQGVNANLVSAHGYGETNPIASNQTPGGRSQNRRVELTLTPE